MTIILEKLNLSHAKALFDFETENRAFFETMVPSRGDHYYEYESFQNILEELLEEQRQGLSYFFLIASETGEIAGRINLIDITEKGGNVGYRVGHEYTGKGIASKALKLLLKQVETLDVRTVLAKTTPRHTGSKKVLERNGFIKTDTDSDFVYYRWEGRGH